MLCWQRYRNGKGGVFNVNQKIYKDFYGYQAFQAVAIYPISRQSQITELQKKLGQFTDMTKWKFVGWVIRWKMMLKFPIELPLNK